MHPVVGGPGRGGDAVHRAVALAASGWPSRDKGRWWCSTSASAPDRTRWPRSVPAAERGGSTSSASTAPATRWLSRSTIRMRPDFGFTPETAARRSRLDRDRHVRGLRELRWSLVRGELPDTLFTLPAASADLVFWDPFSPRSNPLLWSVAAFRAVRRACRAGGHLAHLRRRHVDARRAASRGFCRRGRAIPAARACRPPWPRSMSPISARRWIGAGSNAGADPRHPCPSTRRPTPPSASPPRRSSAPMARRRNDVTRSSASPRPPPWRSAGSARGTPPRAPTRGRRTLRHNHEGASSDLLVVRRRVARHALRAPSSRLPRVGSSDPRWRGSRPPASPVVDRAGRSRSSGPAGAARGGTPSDRRDAPRSLRSPRKGASARAAVTTRSASSPGIFARG